MKPWNFVNTAPWRNAFVLASTYPDDWSDDAGRAVPHPWGTLTDGRYVYEQIGAGEGGSVDAWQFHPPVFTESAAMPANLRGMLKRFIPINYPMDPADWSGWAAAKIQDTDPLQGSRPGMQPDLDLTRLPDKGKYFVGMMPVHNDIERASLYYPDLLRNDPNYGTITFAANIKDPDAGEAWYSKMAPTLAFAVVGGVFAMAEFPTLAMDVVKAAQQGSPSAALTAFMGQVNVMDYFDISSVLGDTSTSVADAFTQGDPGFMGAVNPYDAGIADGAPADVVGGQGTGSTWDSNSPVADTSFPTDGVVTDNPDFTGEGGNSVEPDQNPGMPNAPSIPRQSGINSQPNSRPTSSGAKAGSTPSAGIFGGILSDIFGQNPNHIAPGYPAGSNISLPNPIPIGGNRPQFGPNTTGVAGTSSTLANGAAIFSSPVLIAAVVVGAIAFTLAK